ncbi:hypothetical protein PHLH3_23920 [Pseudomonas sp. St386]|nr:hypothetical protein AK973_2556 [Pseudomonas brassicacearum]RDI07796.1 hypothetical protein DFO59_102603 [Pseudomonas fluorescens]BBP52766.1 hypothetical protein PHLH3_23920 [Pseudomonas sp. St386]BFE98138.1 hypothetical protein GCM10020185_86740 [Pseudomonas brassicacearum subsp. brassicacearum]AOS38214.1 hypothetical protein A0U95_05430 [Pseudomonas brassicacearum]
MYDHIQPFRLVWCTKVARDQIEFSISGCEVMLGTRIPVVQPATAGVIFNFDVVNTVRDFRSVSQAA